MHLKDNTVMLLAGALAGSVAGLFGAGGGMVLVPLLTKWTSLTSRELFPSSVCIILPICVFSLWTSGLPIPWKDSLPYLIGSCLGGLAAGMAGQKIPVKWLHRILGILILWGGLRYLC